MKTTRWGVWVPSDRVLSLHPSVLVDCNIRTLSWYNLQDLHANCAQILAHSKAQWSPFCHHTEGDYCHEEPFAKALVCKIEKERTRRIALLEERD